jgi:uncharacterized protein
VSLLRKLRHLPEASLATAPGPAPLEMLRARVNALLQQQAPAPLQDPQARSVAPRTPSFFTRSATSSGALLSRREVFGPDYTMPGREKIALSPACRAEASLLALLALDPALAAVDFSKALFLDTETTGLSGGTGTVAFLLGLGFFEGDAFVVEQVLVEDLGEELPMLAHLCERLRGREAVVTFNGKSFDFPLLKTRLELAKMEVPTGFGHVDLLHVARRVHTAWGVARKSMKLGALERDVLGFERVDDVPGSEVSVRYMHYLRGGDEALLRGVIDHNVWDIVSMAALLGLYGEPLTESRLDPAAFEGIARSFHRAGATELARDAAERAVAQAGTPGALHVRAELARARGERDLALRDFEALACTVDSAGVRLSLAKLYEHHVKDYARALHVTLEGTGEGAPSLEKRKMRLQTRVSKSAQLVLGPVVIPRDGNGTADPTL